jgi:hypothetical protein
MEKILKRGRNSPLRISPELIPRNLCTQKLSVVSERPTLIILLHRSKNGAVCFELQPGTNDSMKNGVGLQDQ